MKKLLILMGVLMIGLTLVGCDGTSEQRVPPVYAGVTVESVNPFDGTQLITYYKGKRTDLAVKVDIVNASNFTISSIKINGKNYRDWTDQSTSSVLYFNLNTGSTLGETIYSVDEIVYKDGDNTKTVYVDSNNEFEVYVYKDLPTIERENYELEKDTISIDFNVVDTDNVIVADSLIAELFSGETKVAEKVLEVGQSNIEFIGLLADHHYDVKVRADYDLLDSNGIQDDVAFYSGAFATLANSLPSSSITNLVVSSNSITFDVSFNDEDKVTSPGGLSVAIYDGEALVRQMQIAGTVTMVSFDELLNDNEYVLKVINTYNLRDGQGILVNNVIALNGFSTLPRIVPEPNIENLNIEENRVLFDLEIDDPNSLIDEETLIAKLYVDGNLLLEASVLEYVVDFELYNFFSDYEFVIEIEASYDLNDGIGTQTDKVIFSETFTTLINEVPSVVVDDIVVTQGYVTVDLKVFDINDTLKSSLSAILYENDVPVKTIQFGIDDIELVIGYLVKNTEVYSLEIVADYNLRDGYGTFFDHIMFRSVLISLQPKAPAAELINVVALNDSIVLDIDLMDIDETIEMGTMFVYLYLEGVEIDVQPLVIGTNNIVFTDLLSNNEYEIVVESDYDLDDGAAIQENQVLIVGNILTLEKTIPTAIIENEIRTTESIIFDINIIDPDSVIEDGTLKAVLYLSGEPTGDERVLTVGENFDITFDGILSNTMYKIFITVDYDLHDGNEIVTDYELGETVIRTNIKKTPNAYLLNMDADKDSIWFDVDIIDDDTVIVDNLKAILLKDGVATGDEIALDVGLNTNIEFTGIYSDTRYNVMIITDYYLNDESDVVLADILDYEFITTIEKELVTAEIYSAVLGTDSITIDVFVLDDDDTVHANLKAILFKDGIVTGDEEDLVVGDNPNIVFSGLLSDSVYEVKIITDFDLNTDSLVQPALVLDSYSARTEFLGTPSALITSTTTTRDSIILNIIVSDADSTITNDIKAVLYKDDIAGEEIIIFNGFNEDVTFSTLLANNEYVVKIITDYNLNDIDGNQTDIELTSSTITTDAYFIPATTVINLTVTESTVEFDFSYDDVDEVLVDGTMKASLWIADVKVSEKLVYTENVSFDISNMVTDFDFVIKITGDYDLLDGLGEIDDGVILELELSTLAYAAPTALINGVTINQNNVVVDVTVTDDDLVITGSLEAILYDKNEIELEVITLTVGSNVISFSEQLEFLDMYSIVIVANYNLYDGKGEHDVANLQEYFVTVINKLAPQAEFSNIALTTTSITFDVDVYDRDVTFDANLKALLYKDGVATGDEILLSIGANDGESFIGLDSDSDYTIVIVTDYDIDDNNGVRSEKSIGYTTQRTAAKVVPTAALANIVVDYDSITFDVTITDDDTTLSGNTKAMLYKDGVFKTSINLVVGANNSKAFIGLLSNATYTIEIVTDYELNDGVDEVTDYEMDDTVQTTVEKVAPAAIMANEVVTTTSITFDVTIIDDTTSITGNTKAVLYKDGVLTLSEIDLSTGANIGEAFTGLFADEGYEVKIITDYNINTGNGVELASELDNYTTHTVILSSPAAAISNNVEDYDSITFDVTVVDNDSTATIAFAAALYKDNVYQSEVALVVGDNTGKSFTGLLANNDYEVRIIVDYDLLDETGEVTDQELTNLLFTTDEYVLPTTTVTNLSITDDDVTLDVDIDDVDSVLTTGTITVELHDSDGLVASKILTTSIVSFDISGFLSDFDFEIRFTASYNLEDGTGVHVDGIIESLDYKTLARLAPTAVINSLVVHQTTVDMNITVVDIHNSAYLQPITVSLYDNLGILVDSITIELGTDDYEFNQTLDHDTPYTIEITTNYNLWDGNGSHSDAVLFEQFIFLYNKLDPEFEISNQTETTTSITFDVDVQDDDSVINGEIAVELYLDDVYVDEIILSIGANIGESFTGLYSNTEYELRFRSSYDNEDGNETRIGWENYTIVTTDEKVIPTADITVDSYTDTTIIVDITVTDADGTSINRYARIYDSTDTLLQSISLSVGVNNNVTFNTGLLSHGSYIIEVEVDYNLNENTANVNAILDSKIQETYQNSAPTASMVLTNTTDTITVTYDLIDGDSVTSSTVAALYLDDVFQTSNVLSVGTDQTSTFTGLDTNTEYEVRIESTYDLGDGDGAHSKDILSNATVSTDSLVAITNESIDYNRNQVDIDIDDYESVISGQVIATLYENAVPVATYIMSTTSTTTVDMIGLLQNYDYQLVISSGADIYYTHEFTTTETVFATVGINAVEAWVNTPPGSITVTVDIGVDADSLTADATWQALLYEDGLIVGTVNIFTANGSSNPEGAGPVTIVFAGSFDLSSNSYTVVVQADADLNVEPGDVVATHDFASRTYVDAGN